MTAVTAARIYDHPPGHLVLVDRLWPRGIQRDAIDAWWKELAPSDGLRKAYHAGELDYDAFAALYREELDGHARPEVPDGAVLVTAAKALARSHVPVLRKWLD